ncbi:MAG: adenylosuccinate lyase [Candidatus Blackburnbacteria bacterium]|nr:adenylosuccinate lyase [Candidatus Blackburnbacteria bacterium]
MRKLFSEKHKYELWRKIWVALAEAQHKAGIVSKKELADLQKHRDNINIRRILEIEKEIKHDVVAGIKEFAEHAKVGGGKIHLGATSMDIVDNSDILRIKEGLGLIEEKLVEVLLLFVKKVKQYAKLPCIGYTHLQPAEPTTVGYRFAFYAQDLLIDYEFLQFAKKTIKGKGLKGAVGTSASYLALLKGKTMSAKDLEKEVGRKLGFETVSISSQIYTRKFDYLLLSVLNGISSSLAKFASDLRILQSAGFGEWSEAFGEKQVGSSAMPFKKNPISSEKICSLARYLAALPEIALENATLSHLERTLDDSANRRIIIPEAFLAVDEILETTKSLLTGLYVNKSRIAYNLSCWAPFAATESILIEGVKRGANRQDMHETLREISLVAWKAIQKGEQNPMQQLLIQNKEITKYISSKQLEELLSVKAHLGDAPQRALLLVKRIERQVSS